jgi:hypothetical protein
MNFSILPSHLRSFAEAANSIIKKRYGLSSGIVEQSILGDIPIQPTLHWKTKTQYIACEVAERPFPISIRERFAEIVASGHPIRFIVAYPKVSGLSAEEYQKDINKCKKFGIGYVGIDDNKKGTIEYKGISLSLYIPFPPDFSSFKSQIRSSVQDSYEHYLLKGDPDVGLQNIGQIVERLLYTTAEQAKKKNKFNYTNFRPPKYIKQATLINEMIKENVLDNGILGRCKDFTKARNSVSHKPNTLAEAKKIEKKLKDNFITGSKILEDLPDAILAKRYKVKM